jgi:hypothetical protein
MQKRLETARRAARGLAAAAVVAATSAAPAVSVAATVPNPTVTAIAYDAGAKHHPFASTQLNLAAMGYVESEYQLSGTANGYVLDGNYTSDGKWNKTLAEPKVPYATRILVRRPIDPARFNGTVVVEWYNVSGQIDAAALWAQAHTELLRDGYAWVGVSAQKIGVATDKAWDPDRYGALNLPDDTLSYDIFSQAAQALRSQPQLVMGGLPVKTVIAAGESQSAARMFTYVNAFNDDASQVYDGVLIYSRGASGAPIGSGMIIPGPPAAVRADNKLKVLQLETEQDLIELGFAPARQPDTDVVRTWETAGASHFDAYGVGNMLPIYQRDLPKVAAIATSGCRHPLNQLPFQYVVNAAIVSLTHWIQSGQTPPSSPQITLAADGSVVRDANGNAEGGIRMPEMEAATAKNSFINPPGHGNVLINLFLCGALGNSTPFGTVKLFSLYPTHNTYVTRFDDAAKAMLDAGFILQPDYDEAVANAKVANVPN